MNPKRILQDGLTRRGFLLSAGQAACATLAAGAITRTGMAATVAPSAHSGRALLHVAAHPRSGSSAIHTFLLDGERCTHLAATPGTGITAMAMHPSLPLVYAASNALPGQELPHGHLESFYVEPGSGELRRVSRVPMSLSATGPRSIAVSPDGALLLVSAYDGGIWNAFPLDAGGVPVPVALARKELGAASGHPLQSSAHPHSVAYLPATRFAIATDMGADQLTVFSPSSERLSVAHRRAVPTASGPGLMAISFDAQYVFVASHLHPALSTWKVTHIDAMPALEPCGTRPLATALTAMAAHKDAGIVYTTRRAAKGSCLESWTAEGLESARTVPLPSSVAMVQHSRHLWAASSEVLLRFSLDSRGRVQQASLSVPLPGMTTLTLQPL